MHKVTVRSTFNLTPEEIELNKHISEIIFIDKKHSPRQKQLLCKFILKDVKPEFITDLFRKNLNVVKFNCHVINKNAILASVVFRKFSPLAFPATANCSCIVLKVHIKENIRSHTLLVQDKSCFDKHLQDFQKNHMIINVDWVEATVRELTAKQHELLKLAYEMGYYDFPKRIHIRELAKTLGISTAALAETLSTAKKKILSKYFENGV